MSLRWGEHRGRTKSTAEISFQSSFFWIGGLIVARPHLFIFFVFFFFWLNLKFFFFFEIWEWIAKRANDVQKQIFISSLWTDRIAHIRVDSCGYWCPLWQIYFSVNMDLFIYFVFCLNMFIKIQNFLFFGFVFLVMCCNFSLVKFVFKEVFDWSVDEPSSFWPVLNKLLITYINLSSK